MADKYSEAEKKAYLDESRSFYKRTLTSKEIRKRLGIYGRIYCYDAVWNEIRKEVRAIMNRRNAQTMKLDEIMDVTIEIAKIEKLQNLTKEPRKFTNWFIYSYDMNSRRCVRKKSQMSISRDPFQNDSNSVDSEMDCPDVDDEGQAFSDTSSGTEKKSEILIKVDESVLEGKENSKSDWWKVTLGPDSGQRL